MGSLLFPKHDFFATLVKKNKQMQQLDFLVCPQPAARRRRVSLTLLVETRAQARGKETPAHPIQTVNRRDVTSELYKPRPQQTCS